MRSHTGSLRKTSQAARLAILLVAVALGCGKQRSSPSGTRVQAAVAGTASGGGDNAIPPRLPRAEAAPFGRWRLVDPRKLRHVVLGLSHILIRAADVAPREISFSLGFWTAAPPPPARSREQARRLAEHIAKEARRHPQTFSELAALHSEDIATREEGGSLGQLIAAQLTPWPQVLDALSELKAGEVSRVVKTEYGFHIFRLRPPPVEQSVSGARIVIGHTDARWLPLQQCREVPERSRAEARQLANEIYERLQTAPNRFAELVARYSEHCDSMQGGDFGSWSTRAPSPIPREVEKLAGLAVGEIAAPFDSVVGFQLIVRTANRPRATYAMAPIRLVFDPSLPAAAANSKPSVLARARTLARSLRGKPALFPQLQKQLWPVEPETWGEGAGEPPITKALARLPIGAVTPEPVLSGYTYTIARRIDPANVPSRPTQLELPSPKSPDFEYIAEYMAPDFFATQLRDVAQNEVDAQAIAKPVASALLRLHADWKALKGTSPGGKAFHQLQQSVRDVLGAGRYVKYRRHLDEHFAMLYLTPA